MWLRVTRYLMCDPRQLFFIQCGPGNAKIWTHRIVATASIFLSKLPSLLWSGFQETTSPNGSVTILFDFQPILRLLLFETQVGMYDRLLNLMRQRHLGLSSWSSASKCEGSSGMAHNSLSCASQKPGPYFWHFKISFMTLILYSIIINLSFQLSKPVSISHHFYCCHSHPKLSALALLALGDQVILFRAVVSCTIEYRTVSSASVHFRPVAPVFLLMAAKSVPRYCHMDPRGCVCKMALSWERLLGLRHHYYLSWTCIG